MKATHHLSFLFRRQPYRTLLVLMQLLLGMVAFGMPQSEAAPARKTTPAAKKVASLQRKLRGMQKRQANVQTQIDFCRLKIKLHERCRNCSAHCKSQGLTGACRHWAMEPFGGKRIRVCHQLPRGAQRYSGIDQAISSLENKIDVYQNTLSRVEEKIAELEEELDKALNDAGTSNDEP